MKDRLEKSIQELKSQAKKAEQILEDIKSRVHKIDRETAKAQLGELKALSLKEVTRLRETLQGQVLTLSTELSKTTDRLKSESDKMKDRVQGTVKTVREQLKAIAEKERAKRRAQR
jgi:hypothetical protein